MGITGEIRMNEQKKHSMSILSDKTEKRLAAELVGILETLKYGVRIICEEAKSETGKSECK
jgi:hypothetical protein